MKGAVIGLGPQGQVLVQGMRQAGIEVVAVCDINPVQSLSARDIKFYRNYSALFRKEQIDVVGVATSMQHEEIVVAAAQSGAKAILCEKPMASSLAGAIGMSRACAIHGTVLAINLTRRWHPTHRLIHDLTQRGEIGEIKDIEVRCGGGRLGLLGTHFIDWVCWMAASEPVWVNAKLEVSLEPNPRPGIEEPPGIIEMRFANNVSGRVILRENVALGPWFIIEGTRGRIFVEETFVQGGVSRWEAWVRPEERELIGTLEYDSGPCQFCKLDGPEPIDWGKYVKDAFQELMEGKTSCGPREGYEALQIYAAAHISGGRIVRLPIRGQGWLEHKFQIA